VYWRHRIWPKERPYPKPSFEAVMSQAQLEKKVKDYLRNSQALENYWQRPITAEQLQAEMDRMANHTRQPEVLQEFFEALGNNPFVIAECLARPALAERLITNWYAYDQTIHGELKQRAETELQSNPAVGQMKQLNGNYSEIELVRSDSARAKDNRAGHSAKLNNHEWDQAVQRLSAIFGDSTVAAGVSPAQPTRPPPQKPTQSGTVSRSKDASTTQIKTGVVSSLQEDESRYYATAVINKTNDHLKLATVSWPKEPLQSWLAGAENQFSNATTTASDNYTLPAIPGGTCADNTWTPIAAPPDARDSHTVVWTGSEMIVWGGEDNNFLVINTGGKYHPATDTWDSTNVITAPAARTGHTAVWTGSEMVVWGGLDASSTRFNSGANTIPIPIAGQVLALPARLTAAMHIQPFGAAPR